MACSIASFFAVDALLTLSPALLTALYGAAALNIFYWFAGPVLAGSVQTVTGLGVPWLRWPISLVVALLSIVWISRSYWAERRYLVDSAPTEYCCRSPRSRPDPLQRNPTRTTQRCVSCPTTRW